MKRLAIAMLLVSGCAHSDDPVDVGLEGLGLTAVNPTIAIPGTTLAIEGDSFVGDDWGHSRLRLRGDGIDVTLDATFVDYEHMTAAVTTSLLDQLGGDVDVSGEAILEVESMADGRLYASDPLPVDLQFRRELTPSASSVQSGGLLFVNDEVVVEGAGFLLGGTEGQTIAIVDGCFQESGSGTCADVGPVEVPLAPARPFARDEATFAFVPEITGIREGTFDGQVRFENRPIEGGVTMSSSSPITYELISSEIFRIDPTAASLGQYVFIEGGGFVDGPAGTTVRLEGTFTLEGTTQGAPVDIVLYPEFVEGRLVRYVMNEVDLPGIDLRQDTGTFVGTVTPVIRYGSDTVVGQPTSVTLGVAPIKQVVYLDYRPSYVEALRLFGLRAADRLIRARILAIIEAAYPGINIELREEPVTDFALYSHVELHGPDPNGQGLFGYDNTHGKDIGNERLFDRLGGVNAASQQDGFAGYGGVFLESFMGFSEHPAIGSSLEGADPAFDEVFDPFRPDRGEVVTGADLSGGLPEVSGADCPGGDRPQQIACACFVMASLVGGTLAHEIGHSLGLANPDIPDGSFHTDGDAPNRLMDGGGYRPFLERAELAGQGPAMFCDEEYAYLRMILPGTGSADPSPRPACF